MQVIRSPLERQVTLHQLRIFKTVFDLQGFTRAGDALALTQSAVTHHIQALARSVGHPLLEPARGSIELTPVGRALYERAGRILALVKETGDAIDDLAGLRTGEVRVVGDTTVGIYVLPDALASFHRAHPELELSLEVGNRARVRELLLSGEADLGVAGRLWEDGLLRAEPLLENQLMCFSAPDHPLVAREPLEPAALMDGPLLLREPGSGTRESAEAILREHGVEPVPAMQMASNGALKRAVARGLGVTVLSTYAVTLELAQGVLHPLRVKGFPVTRMWHVVWPRERLLSPATQAFRRHLQSSEWRLDLARPLGTD
jgi:LysR family transcriptional regulator, low CO2-responsive transcriptional regulator